MRQVLLAPLALTAVLAGGATWIVQDQCGPFTDITPAFCPYVLELYYLGITAGTSATTFSPDDPLTRGQAAVFVAKGLNQSLARSSRRAALGQWWTTTPHWDLGLGVTSIPGGSPVQQLVSDGSDIWATAGDSVWRIRQSDGQILEEWTGVSSGVAVLAAMGRVFASSNADLYMIDPSHSPGSATLVASGLGIGAINAIAFDGSRIWATSNGVPGDVAIITPGATLPWSSTLFTYSGNASPKGLVFDGTNMWITDFTSPGTMRRFDATGAVLQTVSVGDQPGFPSFDGANIWVPAYSELTVVQSSTGTVVGHLTGNGLSLSNQAAFDGRRILVTNPGDATVSVFDAADLSLIANFNAEFPALNVCSDGTNFWVSLLGAGIGRY